jgi:hypothetical protein
MKAPQCGHSLRRSTNPCLLTPRPPLVDAWMRNPHPWGHLACASPASLCVSTRVSDGLKPDAQHQPWDKDFTTTTKTRTRRASAITASHRRSPCVDGVPGWPSHFRAVPMRTLRCNQWRKLHQPARLDHSTDGDEAHGAVSPGTSMTARHLTLLDGAQWVVRPEDWGC